MEKAFNRLKGLRAERGLTQVDMAKLLGMNPVTYRKKENGERDFTLREVAKAQKVLEIDPQYYFFYKFSNQMVTKQPS
ncbi:helix-turn-helix transcriptional regulator [Enterococcus faecalis]|uniref:helix-turn-helix transcriptional regulator n=1 Tax=Enterococcus faecalis TaxID=1351 RepID=UPI00177B925F|nr:helix-turn-helix transcriptional regulator [Enterococcus faecalis]MBD9843860.1 helix-turn-helix transcriptional regulator [Enterococcus faecalis]MDR9790164.1 helix-turn-helix transcriptional regulator [Enterococcus faecalis]